MYNTLISALLIHTAFDLFTPNSKIKFYPHNLLVRNEQLTHTTKT